MSDTVHIFTPRDDTLAERLRAFTCVSEAFRNVQQAKQYMNDPKWADTLGEPEDIEEAHRIITRSFDMANEAVSSEELKEAAAQGLLSEEQAEELSVQRQAWEFEQISKQKQKSTHLQKGQKK